ncbi:MAG: hypothetical protein JWM92_462 [Candidatus Nomurabacteria bacterium]|nr:hypothetical protein [Candidatus Nomurabacteria bacterium]
MKKESVDLTNIKITYPDTPSRKSEIIHQWSVLTKYRHFKKREDFSAEYEKAVIDEYEKLNAEEKEKCYAVLTEELNSLMKN